MVKKLFIGALLSGMSLAFLLSAAQAKGRLIVYCSAANVLCQAEIDAFSEKYKVDVSFLRNSDADTLTKLNVEKKRPQADVWYGGALEMHAMAAELDLLQPYQSPLLEQIDPRFRDPGLFKGNMTSPAYVGVIGLGVNTDRLKEKNLALPACWSDLLKPEYRNEIEAGDLHSSGAAYVALSTFITLWGEERAFDYIRALDANVVRYVKDRPSDDVIRGSVTTAISFLHDYPVRKGDGIDVIVPCEGTGYEIGGISVVKGGYNSDNARLFVDWILSRAGQELSWQKGDSHYILTNTTARPSSLVIPLERLKLVERDIALYGTLDMRRHLIDRWIESVAASAGKIEKESPR